MTPSLRSSDGSVGGVECAFSKSGESLVDVEQQTTPSPCIQKVKPPRLYEFPIESTLPAAGQKLRITLLLPLTVVQQILLLIVSVRDFVLISQTNDKLVDISDLDLVRKSALFVFLVALIIDSFFLLAALYFGGVGFAQVKQLWPIAGHHIGFSLLCSRTLFTRLDYVAGLAFVAFLSEFCVPMKLCLCYRFAEKTPRSRDDVMNSTIWQLRLLFLEMFMSGACTFLAVEKYAVLWGSAGLLTTQTKRSYTIILTLAICYWTIQLMGSHRVKLERFIRNLSPQQPACSVVVVGSVDEEEPMVECPELTNAHTDLTALPSVDHHHQPDSMT